MDARLLPGTGRYKYTVEIDGQHIRFGDNRYSDYTKHKDAVRKANYIARHAEREDWNDPYTAGFWSRWLLWNKKSIESAKRDIFNRFGIRVY